MNTIQLSDPSTGRYPELRKMRNVVVVVVAIWGAAVFFLTLNGAFNPRVGGPQFATLAAIVLPLVIFTIGWRINAEFREWIYAINMHTILLLHTWRMLGLGFLFLYAVDVLPGMFALPAGLGDAAAAVWASWLASALATGRHVSIGHLRRWNAFGLADFMIAVAMGTLSRSGPLDVFSLSVTSDALGTLPLGLIPAFAVPFFVITHLCVILKLRGYAENLTSERVRS